MNSGKAIRLKRLFDMESKRTLIVPMDHGVTDGNIPGLILGILSLKIQ